VPQFKPMPGTGQDRSTAFPVAELRRSVRDFAPELQATPETADDDRLRLHHDLAWELPPTRRLPACAASWSRYGGMHRWFPAVVTGLRLAFQKAT
jgi:hypothetical protein